MLEQLVEVAAAAAADDICRADVAPVGILQSSGCGDASVDTFVGNCVNFTGQCQLAGNRDDAISVSALNFFRR